MNVFQGSWYGAQTKLWFTSKKWLDIYRNGHYLKNNTQTHKTGEWPGQIPYTLTFDITWTHLMTAQMLIQKDSLIHSSYSGQQENDAAF